jgi:outer membrane protein assembly factor BamC
MEIDEGFDRAWRQVGLALDRTGFTVEDRDRGAGLYFVRYIDPKLAGKDEPNFFAKLFSSDKEVRPQRLRVVVKSAGSKTQVSVQNSEGSADNSEAARTVIGKLIGELK